MHAMHDVAVYNSDTSPVQRPRARWPRGAAQRDDASEQRDDDSEWEAVGRREGREAGSPGLCSWARIAPGDEPLQIDRGRGGDVLQVGFRHPPIPRAAEPKGAHALRQQVAQLDITPPASFARHAKL